MIRAIIFDSYGTLIDTGNGSIQAAKKILKKNNSDIDEYEFYSKWKSYHRKNIDSLTSFLKEEDIFKLDLQNLYNEYKINGNEEDVYIMLSTLGGRTAFPDTLNVIAVLRERYKVYIGSTSDEQPLQSDIKRNGIIVDGIYSSESLKVYKPKKDFFNKILSDINLLSNEVIFVGDSLIDDILGPNSVGIQSIWLNRKSLPIDSLLYKPSYIITDLYQLLEIV